MVSNRDNLNIKLQQGDMRDLSRFDNETFDFIKTIIEQNIFCNEKIKLY